MNTAKPICVIKIDNTGIAPGEDIYHFQKPMEQKMPDYHVFVLPFTSTAEDDSAIKIEVFYEKDFTPIQYEELKKIITDSIDKDKK